MGSVDLRWGRVGGQSKERTGSTKPGNSSDLLNDSHLKKEFVLCTGRHDINLSRER